MESRLHSRVLSARLTQAFNIHNVSRCETVKDGVKGEERDMCMWQACVRAARANSRVIQQQDNRVEFFPGSVIGSERHYEVIETVPCCFG